MAHGVPDVFEGHTGLAGTAELLRSLTTTTDEQRQKAAGPLLLAAGDTIASQHTFAAFDGVRPLLEFLRENGSPKAADWAMAQIALLDRVN